MPVSNASNNDTLQYITEIHPHDVLSGRGRGVSKHIGNKQWRELILDKCAEYASLPNEHKTYLSQSIVFAVRTLNPPGRFLRRDPKANRWYDIGDHRAQEKTSQALREAAANFRKRQNQPYDDKGQEQDKRSRSYHPQNIHCVQSLFLSLENHYHLPPPQQQQWSLTVPPPSCLRAVVGATTEGINEHGHGCSYYKCYAEPISLNVVAPEEEDMMMASLLEDEDAAVVSSADVEDEALDDDCLHHLVSANGEEQMSYYCPSFEERLSKMVLPPEEHLTKDVSCRSLIVAMMLEDTPVCMSLDEDEEEMDHLHDLVSEQKEGQRLYSFEEQLSKIVFPPEHLAKDISCRSLMVADEDEEYLFLAEQGKDLPGASWIAS